LRQAPYRLHSYVATGPFASFLTSAYRPILTDVKQVSPIRTALASFLSPNPFSFRI
jgi:hypothetical protein